MTYLDYIVFFERCDQQQPRGFSGNATRLYHKLLSLANSISWPVDFARADPYVAAMCGLAINTMKECRATLVTGGLLTWTPGGTGRSATVTYKLTAPVKTAPQPSVNPSKIDGFIPADVLNPSNNPSNSDGFTTLNPSEFDGFTAETELNPSTNPSNFDTLYIDKDKEESKGAAHAASPPASSSAVKKNKATKSRPAGATHAEITALPLPFASQEFATTWVTFFTTNPKQQGKALSAFELMLKKLGKYPEAFAVLMLERAIMGGWQGVENAGTARDYAEWQAEQARHPQPAPPSTEQPTGPAPDLNLEFLAERAAREQAAVDEHLAQYANA